VILPGVPTVPILIPPTPMTAPSWLCRVQPHSGGKTPAVSPRLSKTGQLLPYASVTELKHPQPQQLKLNLQPPLHQHVKVVGRSFRAIATISVGTNMQTGRLQSMIVSAAVAIWPRCTRDPSGISSTPERLSLPGWEEQTYTLRYWF
jgi:hypothetical protein